MLMNAKYVRIYVVNTYTYVCTYLYMAIWLYNIIVDTTYVVHTYLTYTYVHK